MRRSEAESGGAKINRSDKVTGKESGNRIGGMGRASARKRQDRSTGAAAPPAVEVGAVVPRSVERLGAKEVAVVRRMQELELERRRHVSQLDGLVADARAKGVSWSAIGWAVGTSGEAARQRWGT